MLLLWPIYKYLPSSNGFLQPAWKKKGKSLVSEHCVQHAWSHGSFFQTAVWLKISLLAILNAASFLGTVFKTCCHWIPVGAVGFYLVECVEYMRLDILVFILRPGFTHTGSWGGPPKKGGQLDLLSRVQAWGGLDCKEITISTFTVVCQNSEDKNK